MKYIIPFFLLLPFMASGQKPQVQITDDTTKTTLEIEWIEPVMARNKLSMSKITLQDVIDCISFDKEGVFYEKTKNLCIRWYELEKKIGCTDEEAAIGTFNMLLELMLDISKQ
jgi:hypothetical protein